MNYTIKKIIGLAIVASVVLAGCGGSGNGNSGDSSSAKKESGELTAFQKEHGIGPITQELDLGEVDATLAKQGEKMFETKCSACHKLDDRYVGPAQRNVLDDRSPEFVMNMVLNPAEMVKKHPVAKKMLAEFMTPMPNQNLSREEARSILEYLRYVNQNPEQNEVQ